ncbi:hypothetical protein [Blastococcus sp. LR1]|uniref:hypothetical protein n=1 Tax=Blastococcus sp. LR1 TaxID=2877000 RepID=UPI001CCDF21B|nr:hypothetical protein [Blastococcus sp. LR1]MCA0146653.1 hypothetical protein [Blastococcus sp. LR1]
MSSVMENRAAVFTNQSQAVEVYRSGRWSAGEILGWRHDESGACQVWVRVVEGGVEETGWTDLTALRLPEAPAVEARPVVADAETTASLPLARDHIAAAAPARAGGRRRAPEGVDVAAARPAGRRRAPEDAAVRRAPASSVPVPVPGRHRAPSGDPDAGRHRDADTELFAAIVDEPAPSSRQRRDDLLATATWSMPAARPVPAAEKIADRPARPTAADELLTRPMRLSDQVPQSRRSRSMAH